MITTSLLTNKKINKKQKPT